MKYSDKQLQMLEKPQICCEDVEMSMGDFVDGELPHALKDRVHDHIIKCEECQRFSWSYQKTVELAKELGSQPIPRGVQQRLRSALNERLGLNLSL